MSKIKNEEFNMLNPLLIKREEFKFDDVDVKINLLNLPKYFSKVYVLCPFKFMDKINDLNFKFINKKLFDELSNILTLYECSTMILKNKFHSSTLNIVDSNLFLCFNNFGYELTDKIVIVPILNFKFLDIQKYIKMYDGQSNEIRDLYNTKFLIEYFSTSKDNFLYNQYLNNMITSLKENNYWTQLYNCLINLKSVFKRRNFRSENGISNIKLPKDSEQNEMNYLDKIFERKSYFDISNVLKKRGFKLYRVPRKTDLNKNDINNMFTNMNDHQKYLLFCNLVVSKEYCHLILPNADLMRMMKTTILNFAELFRYLFSYSFLRFYNDECELKGKINDNSPIIFTLDSASQLPVYPILQSNLQLNPYIPLLVSDRIANNSNGNVFGFPCYKNKLYNNGISNVEEFKIRFNIFTTCQKNYNIFQNVDFKKYKMAITGSAVMACIQKRHPLVNLFDKINDAQIDFTNLYNRYFNEYYPKSDIDVMIKTSDMFEFLDISESLYGDVVANVCSIFSPYAETKHQKFKILKTLFLFVTPEYIQENISNEKYSSETICQVLGNGPMTKIYFDDSEDNINNNIMKLFQKDFERLYQQKLDYRLMKKLEYDKIKLQNKLQESKDKNLEYKMNDYEKIIIQYINDDNKNESDFIDFLKTNCPNYFQMDNVEYQIKLQDISKIQKFHEYSKDKFKNENLFYKDIIKNKINLSYGFKTFISSPHLNHQLEIFPTKRFMMVDTFHKGCVRAYWNGENCYMLPSCVMEHMTYLGIDYRYCSGKQHMVEIINKYRSRGFGTILNEKEKQIYIDYSRTNTHWTNLLSIYNTNESKLRALAFKGISDKIYRPRFFCMDNYVNCTPIDVSAAYNDKLCSSKYEMIANSNDFKNYIKTRYDSLDLDLDYSNYQAINNKTGYINPLNKEIINMTYELYLQKSRNKNYKEIKKKLI